MVQDPGLYVWLQILLLIIGLAILVQGGELFVSAAIRIAEFLRMPRVVIGSFLVSLATTTPGARRFHHGWR
jgi:cation:H+ antiporter